MGFYEEVESPEEFSRRVGTSLGRKKLKKWFQARMKKRWCHVGKTESICEKIRSWEIMFSLFFPCLFNVELKEHVKVSLSETTPFTNKYK